MSDTFSVTDSGGFARPLPPELAHQDDPAYRAFTDALGEFTNKRMALTLTFDELMALANEHPDGARLYFNRMPLNLRIIPGRRTA